jgi:hypothetical protein
VTIASSAGESWPALRESDSQNCLLLVAAYADAAASVEPGAAQATDRIMMSPMLGDFIVTRFVQLGEPPAAPSQPAGHAAAAARIADELTSPDHAAGESYFALVIADPSAAVVAGLIEACRTNPVLAQLPLRCRGLADIEDREAGAVDGGAPDRTALVSVAHDGGRAGHEIAAELVSYAERLLRQFATTPEPGLSPADLTLIRRNPPESAVGPAIASATGRAALEVPAPDGAPAFGPGQEQPDSATPASAAPAETTPADTAPADTAPANPAPAPRATADIAPADAAPSRDARAESQGTPPSGPLAVSGRPDQPQPQPKALDLPGAPSPMAQAPPRPAHTGRPRLPAISLRLLGASLRRVSRWAGVRRPGGNGASGGKAEHAVGAAADGAGGNVPAPSITPIRALVFLVLTCLGSSEAQARWRRGRALALAIDKEMASVPTISYWVRALQGTEGASASTCQPAGRLSRGSLRQWAAHDDFSHTLAEVLAFMRRDLQALTRSAENIARPAVVIVALDAPVADARTARLYDELRQECTVMWITLGHALRLLSPVFQQDDPPLLSDAPDVAEEVVSMLNGYVAPAAQGAAEAPTAPAPGAPPDAQGR